MHQYKKTLKFIALLFTLLMLAPNVLAGDSPAGIQKNVFNIVVNGNKQMVEHYLIDDRTFVSVKDMSDLLGAKASYDDATKTLNIVAADKAATQEASVKKASPWYMNLLYLARLAFVLSGLLLFFQAAVFRNRADLSFVRKMPNRIFESKVAVRRLYYSRAMSLSAMALLFTGFASELLRPEFSLNPLVKFAVVPLLTIIIWFIAMTFSRNYAMKKQKLFVP